ncbi:unnamed protein product [Cuscuta europaea]|uniref:Uncharacterized protein n=1 Tax=Cuscuta europaea TaxID=41803 RepID=A0A9P0Z916_CUSEU|nr:unnamed protein product [Cuscuta europaea]
MFITERKQVTKRQKVHRMSSALEPALEHITSAKAIRFVDFELGLTEPMTDKSDFSSPLLSSRVLMKGKSNTNKTTCSSKQKHKQTKTEIEIVFQTLVAQFLHGDGSGGGQIIISPSSFSIS